MSKITYLVLLILLCCAKLYSQPKGLADEQFIQQLNWYSRSGPDDELFVHTDKTLYAATDSIWFCGYLLKAGDSLSKHTILSVIIVRADNRQIISEQKFLLQNGLCSGNISLPEAVVPGDYQLIAYTNVLDKLMQPRAIFIQPITIKSVGQQGFHTRLILLDSLWNNGKVRFKVDVDISDKSDKQNVILEYCVSGEKMKRSTLGADGSMIVEISQGQLKQANSIFSATVIHNNERQYFSTEIPQIQFNNYRVKFYPEGGFLSDGITGLVGWESTSITGQAVAVTGVLYKNGQAIDTISTNTNGMGKFFINSVKNNNYTFRVLTNNTFQKDSVYSLPKIQPSGIAIHLPHAVVNDTLQINLFAGQVQSARVLIHNYRTGYAAVTVDVPPSGKLLKIALNAVPKGLATITVLDKNGHPIAERLFFAHYNRKITAAIQTDKDLYKKREKINLKLLLKDEAGKTVDGHASLACVQNNRLEASKLQNIVNYYYLDHELTALPACPTNCSIENTGYLEDVLLIKGWRKYTWRDLVKTVATDTVAANVYPVIKGRVFFADKALNKPVSVNILYGKVSNQVSTDNKGVFTLNTDNLVRGQKHRLMFSANEKNQEYYRIILDDPFLKIDSVIAKNENFIDPLSAAPGQQTENMIIKEMEKSTLLKEVKISSTKTGSFYGSGRVKGSNACGDYVNSWGYLNWPGSANSLDNYPPVVGVRYIDGLRYTKTDGSVEYYKNMSMGEYFTVAFINYEGCDVKEKYLTWYDGIYGARDFYELSDEERSLSAPQYLSTLYWKAGIEVNKSGSSGLSFYSSDITGTFRIVVQGITESGVFYSAKTITIK
jgi:hypothetical protein